MIKINNISWKYEKFHRLPMLNKLLTKKLKDNFHLKVKVEVVEDTVLFNYVEPNRICISTVNNKILMKKTDSRIKKLGREYLDTCKPTEKQYLGLFETINGCLDALDLSADVTYNNIIIRQGKNKVNDIPKLNSYPVEKT